MRLCNLRCERFSQAIARQRFIHWIIGFMRAAFKRVLLTTLRGTIARLSSPTYNFGYDISDYSGIDPPFGTLDDSMRWSRLRTIAD